MKKLRIFIDMDGVIADFETASNEYQRIHGKTNRPDKYVDYRNLAWAKEVANQLGYEIDSKTGLVISVNEQSIQNENGTVDTSKALYHGFRHKAITPDSDKEPIPDDWEWCENCRAYKPPGHNKDK